MKDSGSTDNMALRTVPGIFPETATAADRPVPLGRGMDATAFDQHYRRVRLERKSQWLQRIFTGWHFYGEPLGLGMFPGKLCADLFLSPDVGLATIAFMSCSSAILIAPWWMRYRRLNNQHKRFYVFYVMATERCITQKAVTSAP